MLVAGADGRARIEFDLSDLATTFRVLADGHADGGRIGSGEGEVISRGTAGLTPKPPPAALRRDSDRKD